MTEAMKRVLDPCCGSRMFWFDRQHPDVVYGDRRHETLTVTDRSHGRADGQRTLHIEPDVLLVAAGADGYVTDPLAQLEYTLDGFIEAAQLTGQFANDLGIPVLVGGAGGYTPLTYTPIIWSEVVHTIHRELTN